MSNPFDALRKVINHEANQDDDGGFFAQLGGIQPDPEDDAPTARGLFQHWDTDITGPAAIRAVNALLKDHYPVDDGIWGQHCATCITDGGATGADVMPWPCDIYATIQNAKEDNQ